MAATPPGVSFDQIIQKGRDRKKAETLASKIFGNTRRGSTPQLGPRTHSSGSPSLASRINKPTQRSASSSSINRTNVASAFNKVTRAQNGTKLESLGSSRPNNGQGIKDFSIKGAAGPYVVVGSNFAPGTSAADIRSATEGIVGEMQSCVIITSNPTVIAEMVFSEKSAAETIIGTLNNQKADGRLLHVYLKNGPPTRLEAPVTSAPVISASDDSRTVADSPDLFSRRVQPLQDASPSVAEPEYQDGRYGFNSKVEGDIEMDNQEEPEIPQVEQRDDRFGPSSRSDRRGYGQDYARPRSPRHRNYNDSRGYRPRPEQRPQYSERLYSDNLYSNSRQPRSSGWRQ